MIGVRTKMRPNTTLKPTSSAKPSKANGQAFRAARGLACSRWADGAVRKSRQPLVLPRATMIEERNGDSQGLRRNFCDQLFDREA